MPEHTDSSKEKNSRVYTRRTAENTSPQAGLHQ